ncbi:hypothetical protein LSH36_91g01064 [Paralvinella palmiformis]|uniref:F-box/LRR-repeat protein 15-like leucin rich repeat domain-containing protein n=1 Tax=Paralvinella palmiformis TaxID=53620 RepID=A0AAD9NAD7_9ANNE|nr:hypothetical protein LSH36_91g01064 [Paralvinella palmiformis]
MSTFFGTGHETYRDRLLGRRLLMECQLKSLRDMCLEYIGNNLHCITRASQYLAAVHKELIIERLAFHDRFTDSYLPHVTYNLFSPQLEQIYLFRCNQINETWLRQLAASKYAGLQCITDGQDCLKELELRKLKITRKGLVNVRSPNLEKVDLRGCSLLDDKAIQMIVCSNPTIRYLNLVSCSKVTDVIFPIIAQNLKMSLEYLDISDVHSLSDSSIMALAKHCPNLKSLLICFQLFQGCDALQYLDLSYCMQLVRTPSSAKLLLHNLPITLLELSLNGLQLDNPELLVAGMERLLKLSKLRLCGVPAVDDECLKQILKKVGAQLTFLDISGSVMCNITDDGLSHIATCCTKLQMLGISLLKEVTGITLLDVLALRAVAENCCNLKQLDLSGAPVVTDDIIKQLASNCNQMNNIGIKACRNVTDEGVVSLAINCPLCSAMLSGLHNITDRSILALANNCPYLEELYISGCEKVSQAAVNYLQDMCIPRVYVSHRVPNSCSTVRNLDTGNYEIQS